jgi:hypothetical protein
MALSDLLNDGKSSISTVPTSNTTETVLPDWYTNYAMDILANQQAVANNPYVTYQGPRVAGFTDQQKQAFNQAMRRLYIKKESKSIINHRFS